MSNRNELVRRLLSGITDSKLENLVKIREEANRPNSPPRRRRQQEPRSRRSVQELIKYFEDNPIPPCRPILAPRIKKQKPVPAPRTKINKNGGLQKALHSRLKNH